MRETTLASIQALVGVLNAFHASCSLVIRFIWHSFWISAIGSQEGLIQRGCILGTLCDLDMGYVLVSSFSALARTFL